MVLSRFLLVFAAFWSLTPAFAADPPPLRALIIEGQNNHKVWPETTPLLKRWLEQSGRFRTVDLVTTPPKGEDMSTFGPDFSYYDVVVSNYNGDSWPAATQERFEEFVRGGGGFVSVHAADNAFPNWEAYNRMIGVGGWEGRGDAAGPYLRLRDGDWVRDAQTPGAGGHHGTRHRFKVETRRPDHPIMKGLPASWLHATDELYDQMRGPALEVTVLASAYSDPETRGTGEHEPILMVIPYGKGRVFHTTLGHSVEAMSDVGFITTLQRGTEWAATGGVTIPAPADFTE